MAYRHQCLFFTGLLDLAALSRAWLISTGLAHTSALAGAITWGSSAPQVSRTPLGTKGYPGPAPLMAVAEHRRKQEQ